MRYINLSDLEKQGDWPPGKLEKRYPADKRRTTEEWRADLCEAERALRNPPPGKTRSWVINKYSSLWSDVKNPYRELNYGKCWYCDTRTDLGEIDHYRPKNEVEENKSHSGYWWLAFEWRNWRYSCERCNKKLTDPLTGSIKGKGARFPLVDDETYRVSNESEYECYEDLLDEDPLLLDPTRPGDALLLTFTRDGLPKPVTDNEQSWEFRRAEKSIYLYHLDHGVLQNKRQDIYHKIHKHVNDIQRYWKKWKEGRDSSARDLYQRAMEELLEMITYETEYASTARAYLKEYRRNDPAWSWVDQLLTS